MGKNSCKRVIAGSLAIAAMLNLYPFTAAAETDISSGLTDTDIGSKDYDPNKKCGANLSWTLSGNTLTISGSGAMYDLYDNGNPFAKYAKPWLGRENDIQNIVIEEGVTSIGAYAFAACVNATSISIPSSVKSIGFAAFSDCANLKEITIPNGVIGESAFIRCIRMEKVTIGPGVTAMGISAFENCNALSEVHISDLNAWCNIDFGGIYANPVQNSHHLYLNGALVTALDIPNGVKEIKKYAFIENRDITSVNIPASVEKIDDYAFFTIPSLSAVTLPSSGLKYIGNCSFQGCSSLTTLAIPSSVTHIGSYCFAFSPVTSINIQNGYIGDHAFSGCGAIGNLCLGDGVSYIGDYAFSDCAGIGDMEIGYYVSYIGEGAFNNCSGLVSRGYIEYGGTADTWNKIKMGSGNESLTGAKKIRNMNRGTTMAAVPSPKQTVTFGSYEQDNNTTNGAEPISWYVLDVQGDKALIVSKDVLDFQQYAESIKPYEITWEESELRSWLNNDFYNAAFSDSEKAALYTSSLTNENNPVYNTMGGNSTADKVFILSASEAKTYFSNDAERRSGCSAFAFSRNSDPALRHGDFNSSYWWLRTPGDFVYSTMFTHYTGHLVDQGMAGANVIGGVRPAVWVDKNAVNAQKEQDSIADFVDRLYTIILGRSADPDGLADWTNRLKSGTATSAEIVYGFANSQEFNNRGLSNEEIIEIMYNAMLARGSDASGKQSWLNAMANGMTVTGIINGFSGSQEFANLCAGYGIKAGAITSCEARDRNPGLTGFVSRMYTKALGRNFDVDGLNTWTGDYLSGKHDASGIAYGFIFSQEFLNKNLSNDDYVDTLYRTFFDREPDDHRSDWVSKLNGGESRESVLNGFLGSQEFANLKAGFGV